MIPNERISVLREGTESGGRYVLYWMQASQRTRDNPALEYAVRQADARDLPVLVYFGLTESYPEANLRHYTFLVEGLAEVQQSLAERGIAFGVRHGAPLDGAVTLAADAALLITDRGYLRHQKRWYRHVVSRVRCPVIQVEGDVVVPVETAYPREAYNAAVLRRKITGYIEYFLAPLEEHAPHVPARGIGDDDAVDLDKLVKGLDIDRTAGPVHGQQGGTANALSTLNRFIDDQLPRYASSRNEPGDDNQSGLSPYLHFGQISPVEIAQRVRATGGEGADSFIEQVVVRRELAMNYVHYNSGYDTLAGLPRWARVTLQAHASDPRDHLYTAEHLEKARTHDPYWNAAQIELLTIGRMHGYMRMYWGKKILEWSTSPEEAMRVALWLNNRYELDGRDPNSYAGVA
ncbi:MAG: deoxyribodipyrimidine photo-lyase, partial [Candidatus Bipolaricaulota bacterium]